MTRTAGAVASLFYLTVALGWYVATMKKIAFLPVAILVFGIAASANAGLMTIGQATYLGSNYKLIYEDDSIDGGLVWLDYTKPGAWWDDQIDWAAGIGGSLTVNLYPEYSADIDWSTGWRLPLTQDETEGYNQTGSEMGHLYYISLGNTAHQQTDFDTDDFDNLQISYYLSGTEYSGTQGWDFNFDGGYQGITDKDASHLAIAVRPGNVAMIPEPIPSLNQRGMIVLGTLLLTAMVWSLRRRQAA